MTSNRKTGNLGLIIAGVIIIAVTVLGSFMNWNNQSHLMVIASLIGTAVFVVLFIAGSKFLSLGNEIRFPKFMQSKLIRFLVMWGVMFVCWIPVFLAYYPVLFNYDVINQYTQILTGEYNTHHPLIHTLFCQFFYKIGAAAGSEQAGFALHAIVQLLLLSLSLTDAVNYLIEKRIRGWIILLAYLWCCLFIVNPVLGISITKDTLFAAITLHVFVLLLKSKDQVVWFRLIPALLCMLLLRNNAIYAVVFMLVFALPVIIKSDNKAYSLKLVGSILISVILSVLVSRSLNAIFEPEPGNFREALSVPMQQLSAVYVENENELITTIGEDNLDLLTRCIFVDNMRNYHPEYSDYVKMGVNTDTIMNHKLEFLKMYLKCGVKYPKTYIMAFLKLTQGFWYTGDESAMHIYDGWADRQGYLLTDMKPCPGVNVVHVSKFSWLENILERFTTDNIQFNWPVISLLFQAPMYIVLFILSFVRSKKRQETVFAGLLITGLILTNFLAPGALLRYSYPVMLTAIILAPLAFLDEG